MMKLSSRKNITNVPSPGNFHYTIQSIPSSPSSWTIFSVCQVFLRIRPFITSSVSSFFFFAFTFPLNFTSILINSEWNTKTSYVPVERNKVLSRLTSLLLMRHSIKWSEFCDFSSFGRASKSNWIISTGRRLGICTLNYSDDAIIIYRNWY